MVENRRSVAGKSGRNRDLRISAAVDLLQAGVTRRKDSLQGSGAGAIALALLALLLQYPTSAQAGVKDNVAYAGLILTQFEYKNLPDGNEGGVKSEGFSLAFGTYITDYFKAEFRAGFGQDDNPLAPGLTGGINQSYSGYLGGEYPVTEYMALYALFGFTNVVATAERVTPGSYPLVPGDLVESSFSASYLLGGSVRVYKNIHAFIDYGRLHADSLTGLDTKNLNFGLKYEY